MECDKEANVSDRLLPVIQENQFSREVGAVTSHTVAYETGISSPPLLLKQDKELSDNASLSYKLPPLTKEAPVEADARDRLSLFAPKSNQNVETVIDSEQYTTLEQLIDSAFGEYNKNTVNFKLIEIILFELSRHMRIHQKEVKIVGDKRGQPSTHKRRYTPTRRPPTVEPLEESSVDENHSLSDRDDLQKRLEDLKIQEALTRSWKEYIKFKEQDNEYVSDSGNNINLVPITHLKKLSSIISLINQANPNPLSPLKISQSIKNKILEGTLQLEDVLEDTNLCDRISKAEGKITNLFAKLEMFGRGDDAAEVKGENKDGELETDSKEERDENIEIVEKCDNSETGEKYEVDKMNEIDPIATEDQNEDHKPIEDQNYNKYENPKDDERHKNRLDEKTSKCFTGLSSITISSTDYIPKSRLSTRQNVVVRRFKHAFIRRMLEADANAKRVLSICLAMSKKVDEIVVEMEHLANLQEAVNAHVKSVEDFTKMIVIEEVGVNDRLNNLRLRILQARSIISRSAKFPDTNEFTALFEWEAILKSRIQELVLFYNRLQDRTRELKQEFFDVSEFMEAMIEMKADIEEVEDALHDKVDLGAADNIPTIDECSWVFGGMITAIDVVRDKFTAQDETFQAAVEDIESRVVVKCPTSDFGVRCQMYKKKLRKLYKQLHALEAALGKPMANLSIRPVSPRGTSWQPPSSQMQGAGDAATFMPDWKKPTRVDSDTCCGTGDPQNLSMRHYCRRPCGGSHTLVLRGVKQKFYTRPNQQKDAPANIDKICDCTLQECNVSKDKCSTKCPTLQHKRKLFDLKSKLKKIKQSVCSSSIEIAASDCKCKDENKDKTDTVRPSITAARSTVLASSSKSDPTISATQLMKVGRSLTDDGQLKSGADCSTTDRGPSTSDADRLTTCASQLMTEAGHISTDDSSISDDDISSRDDELTKTVDFKTTDASRLMTDGSHYMTYSRPSGIEPGYSVNDVNRLPNYTGNSVTGAENIKDDLLIASMNENMHSTIDINHSITNTDQSWIAVRRSSIDTAQLTESCVSDAIKSIIETGLSVTDIARSVTYVSRLETDSEPLVTDAGSLTVTGRFATDVDRSATFDKDLTVIDSCPSETYAEKIKSDNFSIAVSPLMAEHGDINHTSQLITDTVLSVTDAGRPVTDANYSVTGGADLETEAARSVIDFDHSEADVNRSAADTDHSDTYNGQIINYTCLPVTDPAPLVTDDGLSVTENDHSLTVVGLSATDAEKTKINHWLVAVDPLLTENDRSTIDIALSTNNTDRSWIAVRRPMVDTGQLMNVIEASVTDADHSMTDIGLSVTNVGRSVSDAVWSVTDADRLLTDTSQSVTVAPCSGTDFGRTVDDTSLPVTNPAPLVTDAVYAVTTSGHLVTLSSRSGTDASPSATDSNRHVTTKPDGSTFDTDHGHTKYSSLTTSPSSSKIIDTYVTAKSGRSMTGVIALINDVGHQSTKASSSLTNVSHVIINADTTVIDLVNNEVGSFKNESGVPTDANISSVTSTDVGDINTGTGGSNDVRRLPTDTRVPTADVLTDAVGHVTDYLHDSMVHTARVSTDAGLPKTGAIRTSFEKLINGAGRSLLAATPSSLNFSPTTDMYRLVTDTDSPINNDGHSSKKSGHLATGRLSIAASHSTTHPVSLLTDTVHSTSHDDRSKTVAGCTITEAGYTNIGAAHLMTADVCSKIDVGSPSIASAHPTTNIGQLTTDAGRYFIDVNRESTDIGHNNAVDSSIAASHSIPHTVSLTTAGVHSTFHTVRITTGAGQSITDPRSSTSTTDFSKSLSSQTNSDVHRSSTNKVNFANDSAHSVIQNVRSTTRNDRSMTDGRLVPNANLSKPGARRTKSIPNRSTTRIVRVVTDAAHSTTVRLSTGADQSTLTSNQSNNNGHATFDTRPSECNVDHSETVANDHHSMTHTFRLTTVADHSMVNDGYSKSNTYCSKILAGRDKSDPDRTTTYKVRITTNAKYSTIKPDFSSTVAGTEKTDAGQSTNRTRFLGDAHRTMTAAGSSTQNNDCSKTAGAKSDARRSTRLLTSANLATTTTVPSTSVADGSKTVTAAIKSDAPRSSHTVRLLANAQQTMTTTSPSTSVADCSKTIAASKKIDIRRSTRTIRLFPNCDNLVSDSGPSTSNNNCLKRVGDRTKSVAGPLTSHTVSILNNKRCLTTEDSNTKPDVGRSRIYSVKLTPLPGADQITANKDSSISDAECFETVRISRPKSRTVSFATDAGISTTEEHPKTVDGYTMMGDGLTTSVVGRSTSYVDHGQSTLVGFRFVTDLDHSKNNSGRTKPDFSTINNAQLLNDADLLMTNLDSTTFDNGHSKNISGHTKSLSGRSKNLTVLSVIEGSLSSTESRSNMVASRTNAGHARLDSGRSKDDTGKMTTDAGRLTIDAGISTTDACPTTSDAYRSTSDRDRSTTNVEQSTLAMVSKLTAALSSSRKARLKKSVAFKLSETSLSRHDTVDK